MGTRARRKARIFAGTLAMLVVAGSLVVLPALAGASELSIAIDKTVYVGHNGGGGCPGGESAEGENGTKVTFCFTVTNTGTENLTDAAVGDPALGITSSDMKLRSGNPALIEPGASVVWFYQTKIRGDLVNKATVGAFPEDPSGGPSYGEDPVVASDTAAVTEVSGGPSGPLEPGISIDKTVYPGHNGGASCPGEESVTVEEGDDLTFCFQVTNTGDTYLADVTITDAILGITQDQMTEVVPGSLDLMAPGDTANLYYETEAGAQGYTNVAETTGIPSDSEGEEIPDAQPPTDDDDASVDVESDDRKPEPVDATIDIIKVVYEGHDDGSSCSVDLDGEKVEKPIGTDITYCFHVTNTGEAHLADVTVDDNTLNITDAQMTLLDGKPSLLAPSATAVWYFEDTLEQDLINVAETTGTPATPQGEILPEVEKPTAKDDAEVIEFEVRDEDLEPDIQIDKTVYKGHNAGSGCATAGESVFAPYGTEITYCFAVTNTGTTYLANVRVDDPDLGITNADMTLLSGNPSLLAPGATVVWYYETTLDADLRNVATTTGTPSEPDGTTIPAEPPTDSDDALVAQEEVLGQELPSTGIDADVIAWIGALMLGSGAVLLAGGRKRRGTVASLAASLQATPRVWRDHSTALSRLRATARRRRLRR